MTGFSLAPPANLPIMWRSLKPTAAKPRRRRAGPNGLLVSAGLVMSDQPFDDWSWHRHEPFVTAWLETATSVIASAIQSTAATTVASDVVIDGVMPVQVLERCVAGTRQQLIVVTPRRFPSPCGPLLDPARSVPPRAQRSTT